MGIIEGLRHDFPHIEWSDIRPSLLKLRRSKDDDELILIRRSIASGEAAMAAAITEVEPGITEFEAYQRIARAAMDRLGEPAIVYGDFVSGPRTEKVGGPPSSRVIERGDLFILDMSVVVRGYRGDFANSFVVGARPTASQVALYEVCLRAMKAGEAMLKPGVEAREVDRVVRWVLDSAGLGRFPSHSGHGLGLGHPEAPFVVPESSDTIEVGDVVTLEPGQYVDGLGGMRFERNYLITPTGFETLSNHELRIDQSG
jgi:Xaa-Pro dipeptidase